MPRDEPPQKSLLDLVFGSSLISEMQADQLYRVLSNSNRLQILAWLKNPTENFRAQVDGDLVEDGVCALLISEKLGVSASTLSQHMRLLVDAGLVTPKKIKQWTFYRRNEAGIADIVRQLANDL